MKKRLLLTGGTGFLGSVLASLLYKQYDLYILIRKSSSRERLKEFEQHLRFLHIEESTIFDEIEEQGFHGIIHCAVEYGRKDIPYADVESVNVTLPLNLYNAAQKTCTLFLNSDTYYHKYSGDTSVLSAYRETKEQLRKELTSISDKCRVVHMVIEHMYGAYDKPSKFVQAVAEKIARNEASLALTPGEQVRDFIYVDDVAAAYKAVCDHYLDSTAGESVYSVGSGSGVTLREFVEKMKSVFESETTLDFGDLAYRDGEIMSSIANNTELRKLGWSPSVNLETGLELLRKSFQ